MFWCFYPKLLLFEENFNILWCQCWFVFNGRNFSLFTSKLNQVSVKVISFASLNSLSVIILLSLCFIYLNAYPGHCSHSVSTVHVIFAVVRESFDVQTTKIFRSSSFVNLFSVHQAERKL